MNLEITTAGELYDKLKELKHLDRGTLQLVKTDEGVFIRTLQPDETPTGLLFSQYEDRELVIAFGKLKEEHAGGINQS
ncbi:MAG: hypothetical protein GXO91_02315 [FCB group bacterium]|nr:hypothetical protein [FCB group bacterium]